MNILNFHIGGRGCGRGLGPLAGVEGMLSTMQALVSSLEHTPRSEGLFSIFCPIHPGALFSVGKPFHSPWAVSGPRCPRDQNLSSVIL